MIGKWPWLIYDKWPFIYDNDIVKHDRYHSLKKFLLVQIEMCLDLRGDVSADQGNHFGTGQ
jgi:hypothetical protein